MSDRDGAGTEKGMSKLKVAVGAASLFLFIIGVKRNYRLESAEEGQSAGDGGSAAVSGAETRREERRKRPRRRTPSER